jgi:hypothetical protein
MPRAANGAVQFVPGSIDDPSRRFAGNAGGRDSPSGASALVPPEMETAFHAPGNMGFSHLVAAAPALIAAVAIGFLVEIVSS